MLDNYVKWRAKIAKIGGISSNYYLTSKVAKN